MKRNDTEMVMKTNLSDRFEALKRIPEFGHEVNAIKELKEGRDSIEIMFSDEYFLVNRIEEDCKKKWNIDFIADQRGMTVEESEDAGADKEVSVKTLPFQEAENNVSYLRDGRYVKFLVDISVDKDEALQAISDLIDDFRNITPLQEVKKNSRDISEKKICWDTYDRVSEKVNRENITLDQAIQDVVEELYEKSETPTAMKKIMTVYENAATLIQQEKKDAEKRSKTKK